MKIVSEQTFTGPRDAMAAAGPDAAIERITLRQLRYFQAVAQELHFGRAARRLNLSQPPLSMQIRDLEALLGVQLFDRSRSHVRLTEAGAQLALEAPRLVLLLAQTIENVRKRASGRSGPLRVGFVTPAAHRLLPPAIAQFRQGSPDVELVLREMTADVQWQALRAQTIDVGCVLQAAVTREFECLTVFREPLVVALPARDPMARAGPVIALKKLALRPLVIFPRQHAPELHDSIIGLCRSAGFSPQIGQQAIEMQTIVSLVCAQMGMAIVPASVASLGLKGVVYRRVRERAPLIEFALVWRRGADSTLLQRFCEAVLAAGARLTP